MFPKIRSKLQDIILWVKRNGSHHIRCFLRASKRAFYYKNHVFQMTLANEMKDFAYDCLFKFF